MKLHLLAAGVTALAFPALADTIIASPPSNTTVVFGNALTVVLTLCVPPVAAILAGALWKLAAMWGVQATAQDKANTEAELQAALAFGVSKAGPAIAARGWDKVDVHSQILATAARYFLERFPDRAATIVTAANATPEVLGVITKTEAVSDTLSARLPEAMTIAAASPATPPVPPSPAGVTTADLNAAELSRHGSA